MASTLVRAKNTCLLNYRHNKPLVYILTIVSFYTIIYIDNYRLYMINIDSYL